MPPLTPPVLDEILANAIANQALSGLLLTPDEKATLAHLVKQEPQVFQSEAATTTITHEHN